LKELLESLKEQTYKNFEIIARDDGSRDNTVEILKTYGIKVIEGSENIGAKESFAELLNYALEHTDIKYFSFCDQDDIWKPDKFEKTFEKMQQMEEQFKDLPLLVHTDMEVVDENKNLISKSFWQYELTFPQYNSFNRLLIQNTITGCTVMINRKLAQLSLPIGKNAVMHDWWVGLVASKFGKIGYIKYPSLKYRQHSNNTIGAKNYKIRILKHLIGLGVSIFMRNGEYIKHLKINIDQAKSFLEVFENRLDKETIFMLKDFIEIEQKSFWKKRKILLRYKLFKQGLIRNLGLFIEI